MGSAGQDLTQCYNSIQADGAAVSQVWSQGVSSTTQGRMAVQSIDNNVAQLWHLNSNDKDAVKAGYALYDTWIKTGSPSPRSLQALLNAVAGAALPSALTGTYQTLGGAVTPECQTAYKTLNQLYNQYQNNQGTNNNNNNNGGGGLPGLSPNNMGSGSNGGMPGGESFSNPFGTSMSGQDPPGTNGLGTAANPGSVGQMAGTDDPNSPTSSSPQVADGGTNKCKTFNSGNVGVQLCQGNTVTSSSATITGSVINVGQDTLCHLSLIIDQFEMSSSYYPAWLPTYTGFFMPGDTITFGVTVPYTSGSPRPQADIDSSITVCEPPTTSPTAVPGQNTAAPTTSPTTDDDAAGVSATDPNTPTKQTFDWTKIGGIDTTCVKGCQNIIQGMQGCDVYDAIGAFRCDSCSASTYAAIQATCLAENCGGPQCHTKPMVAHSGASQSVKVSLSLLIGLVSVFCILLL